LSQEEFGAALVQHVDQRSDGDRGYHQNDVDLHGERRQKNRKFYERIAGEHWITLLAGFFANEANDGMAASSASH
jgi:hypothetical protein